MTCDRVLIINKGRVVEVDTPEELTRRLQGSERIFLKVREFNKALLTKIKRLVGVINITPHNDGLLVESKHDLRGELAAIVVSSGGELLELRAVGMSLEEVFLQLTTEEEGEM